MAATPAANPYVVSKRKDDDTIFDWKHLIGDVRD